MPKVPRSAERNHCFKLLDKSDAAQSNKGECPPHRTVLSAPASARLLRLQQIDLPDQLACLFFAEALVPQQAEEFVAFGAQAGEA